MTAMKSLAPRTRIRWASGVVGLLLLVAVPLAGASDWPTYRGDNTHAGYAANESVLTGQTAATLGVKWSLAGSSMVSVEPTIANGHVYWGTWDGGEHAAALDGTPTWTTNLGTTQGGCSGTYGVVSSATVATIARGSTVFVGGGDGQFYALDAATGAIVWKTRLGPSPATVIWASPVFYNGSIYISTASADDCPLVQAKVYRLDSSTGAVQNTFKVVPDGCLGASVWGSPTVDPSTGNLYFATGNDGACSTSEPYAEAIVALRISDLAYVDSWQVPNVQMVADGDFGSTPTLFQATINGVSRPLLGVANKNGVYYALDRTALSAGPVWEYHVAVGGPDVEQGEGSISPSVWDGADLYVAGGQTTINGTTCPGGLRALDPATGQPVWEDCLDGVPLGAVTGAPGLVAVGAGPTIHVVRATTGASLFTYSEPSGQWFVGGGAISDGVLYYGNSDGMLLAFSPQTGTQPTTQTFAVAAGQDDGDVTVNDMGSGGMYPPTGTAQPWTTGTQFGVRRAGPLFGGYEVRTGLLRFDTSSIPPGATITAASLRLYVMGRTAADGRNLVAEWDNGAAWPLDAGDYTVSASNSASTGLPIAGLTTSSYATLPLRNLTSISSGGYTTIRLHVDGGQPTGENNAFFASFENGSATAPQLVVTYTTSAGSAPANTGLPVVSGSAQVGQVLSASTGSWTNSPTSFAYQWQSGASVSGSFGDIAGATGSSYTPVGGDVGKFVRVLVTARNAAGPGSAASDPVGPVAAAGPVTVSFLVGAGGDDGDVGVSALVGGGWPPAGAAAPNSSGGYFTVGKRKAFGHYEVFTGLVRVDTSALPDNAQISSATLTVYSLGKSDHDGRSLIGSWYPASNWPIDAADYALDVGTTALAGTPLAGIASNAATGIALQNVGQISLTGYTALRLGLTGGVPSGDNYLQIAAVDGLNPPAKLTVTYTPG